MDNSAPKRILYVEDDDFIADMVKQVLEEAGHTVEVAPDGDEGLRKLRQSYYDIVVLDIMLPKMDGLTLLETITKENIKQGKIIMFTNLLSHDIKEKSLEYGATDYIVKADVTPLALRDKLHKL